MADLQQFTNLYPLSKTLRFELIPVGSTLSNIQKNGIIDADVKRAESYKKMKETIDEYHKAFIDRCLSDAKLSKLKEFEALYLAGTEEKHSDKWKKDFKAVKQALRKEIVKCFKDDADFKSLDKKELIQKNLKPWIDQNNQSLYFDEDFRNFTTYFTGYNTNRMNMYSEEEKATAVAHRLIDENLPKFIDNISIFKMVAAEPAFLDTLQRLQDELEPWINVNSLEEVFCLDAFSSLLTQPQIDAYNTLIGGRKDGDVKVQGLNEYINLFNQTHPGNKLPKLKPLYKQILSDRVSASWLPESFGSATDLLDRVNLFYQETILSDGGAESLPEALRKSLSELSSADLSKVFIRNDASVSDIANRLFGYYGAFRDALSMYYSSVIEPKYDEKLKKAKNAKAAEKLEKEKRDYVIGSRYHSVQTLQDALDLYMNSLGSEANPAYTPTCVADYFSVCFTSDTGDYIGSIYAAYDAAADLLNTAHPTNYRLTQEDKDKLKALLDSILALLHFAKPLYVRPDSELMTDAVFYGTFTPLYEELQKATKLYDMVRNYATQKPYSTEKIKLNFNCSTLLDGWDVNKETQNLGVLFLRDGKYYLGVMDKAHNHSLEKIPEYIGADAYQKVQYKLLPGPNKMLPKVFFSKSRIEEFDPSPRVLSIYKKESFKKGASFDIDDCRHLIDFYKASIKKHPEWCQFNFRFSDTDTYQDISGFYREISEQGYKLSYKGISEKDIDELVNSGKLYLFQIYNKDFSPYSKGRPNLHTMYWKALFDAANLKDVVYKLNGEAEIFYRKHSIEEKDRIIHPAGHAIASKNPLLEGKTETFAYDLIKDRRYTLDKFQFHVPITMNFKADGRPYINDDVCDWLKNNPDVKIIGIDRGERHLLYISMIDRDGHVVRDRDGKLIQYSLNTITGSYKDAHGKTVAFETPYHELLDKKEKEREQARENWGTVENIKELKEGYLSQVVHHIARLMVEYGAIVVMEDLNKGFKNSRFKVEKQVYQKFEKALIEKLNYLVFKDADPDVPGGLYHALQLTNKFSSFRELTKQCGFIFYVPAWNTSKIDPVTGFVDLLKPKYRSMDDARAFFSKFRSISYNTEKDWFEFDFSYDDFGEKASGSRTDWTVCTHGDLRYAFNHSLNNGKGGYEKCNVTERLKSLFDQNGIDWRAGDLRAAICAQNTAGFFNSLIKDLQITLAMRYSSAEDGKDFILSPVADENGVFFSSEQAKAEGLPLPQDADANGAFNIARKGLWVLEQIDAAKTYKDWTTAISNREWLSYVQTRFES